MCSKKLLSSIIISLSIAFASVNSLTFACGSYPTVVDTTGDVSSPGIPSSPVYFFKPSAYSDYLIYDTVNFYVYSRTMHQRQVIVAISKDVVMKPEERSNLSQFIFNAWASQWKAFNGYLYDQFRVKVVNNSPYDGGESIWGFEKSAYQFIDINGTMKNCWQEFFAHGIFHAFPTYDEKKWFQEGFTQYYGYREEYYYLSHLNGDLTWYKNEIVGSTIDIPLSDANIYFGTPNSSFYYRKGALVAYMLDKEIILKSGCLTSSYQSNTNSSFIKSMKFGDYMDFFTYFPTVFNRYWPCKSLDNIYHYYHLVRSGQKPNVDPLVAVNEVTGFDFTDFFNKFIYGVEELPLTTITDYLDHGPFGSGSLYWHEGITPGSVNDFQGSQVTSPCYQYLSN
jgi:hypothetical protein